MVSNIFKIAITHVQLHNNPNVIPDIEIFKLIFHTTTEAKILSDLLEKTVTFPHTDNTFNKNLFRRQAIRISTYLFRFTNLFLFMMF